jgi:FkbM family methyltransferase
MPVSGLRRYVNLFKNFSNPFEYLTHKFSGKRKPEINMITKPNAIRFSVPRPLYLVFKELFLTDVYNIEELVKQLPPNPTVIDIGANGGYFNVLLLSKIPTATIYAYEPMPANITYLKKIIQENEILKQSLKLHQTAVTDIADSTIEFFTEANNENQVVASVVEGFNKNNTQKITVNTTNLTAIIANNQIENIDLLKVDCEGSEYEIFYGTDAAVFSKIRYMIVESHDLDLEKKNFNNLKSYIESLGFSVTSARLNDWCHALECRNKLA